MAFALVRYNLDGTLDGSFGSGGVVTTSSFTAGLGGDQVFAIAIDPFGRIVAAGHAPTGAGPTLTQFALARYKLEGQLDFTFGELGKVLNPFHRSAGINGIAIDGSGRIVVAGFVAGATVVSPPLGNFALARYQDNGNLDLSFGDGGKVFTDFPSALDELARAIAIDGFGRIVAAGVATVDGANRFALARYNPDGSLNSSFGDGGMVLTAFPPAASAEGMSIAIDRFGRIVAAGVATVDGASRFALARYNPDGTLDSSFGSGGRVLTNFSSTDDDQARAVAIDGFGKIVAAGVGGTLGGASRFALARYIDDGTLDPSFSGDGRVLTDFVSTQTEGVDAIAIDRFGRIVAVGTAVQGVIGPKRGHFAVARYENNGNLDTSFGGDGKVLTNLTGPRLPSARAVAIDGLSRIIVAGFASPEFA